MKRYGRVNNMWNGVSTQVHILGVWTVEQILHGVWRPRGPVLFSVSHLQRGHFPVRQLRQTAALLHLLAICTFHLLQFCVQRIHSTSHDDCLLSRHRPVPLSRSFSSAGLLNLKTLRVPKWVILWLFLIKQTRNSGHQQSRRVGSSSRSDSSSCRKHVSEERENEERQVIKKAFNMFLIINIIFILTWLPYMTVDFYFAQQAPAIVYKLSTYLIFTISLTNFPLFITYNRSFRAAVMLGVRRILRLKSTSAPSRRNPALAKLNPHLPAARNVSTKNVISSKLNPMQDVRKDNADVSFADLHQTQFLRQSESQSFDKAWETKLMIFLNPGQKKLFFCFSKIKIHSQSLKAWNGVSIRIFYQISN